MHQPYINAARAPLSARCATRLLSLTTTDASVTLPGGGYELVLSGASDVAVLGLGVSTTGKPDTSPTTGLSVLPPGGSAELVCDGETTLHARTLSGTGTLYIIAKAEG